jgi:hypothetical protein
MSGSSTTQMDPRAGTNPRIGFYVHLGQARVTSPRSPEGERLAPYPLYSVGAEVRLYPDQQDVVTGQRCLGAEITKPPPHRDGVMQDAGYGLPEKPLLGTSVNRPA